MRKKKSVSKIDEAGIAPGEPLERIVSVSPRLRPNRVHPWLHHDGDEVVVGRVRDDGRVELVTSRRQVYAVADQKARLLFAPRALACLSGRWSDARVAEWCAGGAVPRFTDVLLAMLGCLETHLDLPRPQIVTIGVWTLATYFHRCFLGFPRLNLAGERGSGKTKVLECLEAMALNASVQASPTPAVLFRLIQETRGTVLLDEAENLDHDDRAQILAVINAGYRTTGVVMRVEGEGANRHLAEFEIYGPMALAAIKSLHPTTEDRCIPITMQRGLVTGRLNTKVNPTDDLFAAVRDGACRLLLARVPALRAALRTVILPDWLIARPRELWEPLLVLAALVDHESPTLGITQDLLAAAREHVAGREDLSAESGALIAVIDEQGVGLADFVVRPGALAPGIKLKLGWRDAPTAEQVAAWLRRLGFKRAGRDREGAFYPITRARLEELASRYLRPVDVTPAPGGTGTVTPSPSQGNLAL